MNEIVPGAQPRMPMPKAANLTQRQWKLLVDVIFPSAKTVEGILNALDYCLQRKLDIFKRPVHVVSMWNSELNAEVETVWPGINELEITAHRTKQWAGMDLPQFGPLVTKQFSGRVQEWGGERGKKVWNDRVVTVTYPEWAAVTVYRMVEGYPRPFAEQVFWEEIYAKLNRWVNIPNARWTERPRGQLIKCCKAASLRAAFPEEITDYTNDEMEGKTLDAGGVVIDHGLGRQVSPSLARVSQTTLEPKSAVSEAGTIYDLETGEVVPDKPIPDQEKQSGPPIAYDPVTQMLRATDSNVQAALDGDDISWLDPEDKRRAWVEDRVAKLQGIQKAETLLKWLENPDTTKRRMGLKKDVPAIAETLEAAIIEAEKRLLPQLMEPHEAEIALQEATGALRHATNDLQGEIDKRVGKSSDSEIVHDRGAENPKEQTAKTTGEGN